MDLALINGPLEDIMHWEGAGFMNYEIIQARLDHDDTNSEVKCLVINIIIIIIIISVCTIYHTQWREPKPRPVSDRL